LPKPNESNKYALVPFKKSESQGEIASFPNLDSEAKKLASDYIKARLLERQQSLEEEKEVKIIEIGNDSDSEGDGKPSAKRKPKKIIKRK